MKKRKSAKKARKEPEVEETNQVDGYSMPFYEMLSPAYKHEKVSHAYNSRINHLDLRLHDLDTDDSGAESRGEENAARHQDVLWHKRKTSWTAVNHDGQPRRKQIAVFVAYGIFALFFFITIVRDIYNSCPMKSRCKDEDIYVLVGKTGVGKHNFVAQLEGSSRFGFSPNICRSHDSCMARSTFYETTYNDEMICLLDVPDGSGLSGEDTLKQLFSQLPESPRVKGLLYFYDISSELVEAQPQEDMRFISHLTGGSRLDRIILVTVSHRLPQNRVERAADEVHARALREKYWRHMLQRDSRIMHFEPFPGSASKIIQALAVKPGRIRLSSIDTLVEFLKSARVDLGQLWQKLKTSLKDIKVQEAV